MSSFRRSDELPRGTSTDSRRRAPTTETTKPAAAKPAKPFVPHEAGWTYERNPKRPSVQLYRHDVMCVVTQDNIYDEATRNHVVAMRDEARDFVCMYGYESFAKESIVIVHNGIPRAIYKKNESIIAFKLVERTKWDQDAPGEKCGFKWTQAVTMLIELGIDELNDVL
ncbi:hypothetical protein EV714DRAFT_280608 [Schizophyllum commune]